MGGLGYPLAFGLGDYFSGGLAPSVRTEGAGALDLQIDPITRDLIDTDDGVWLESNDSRTGVLFQLESTYAAWWADARSGSRIKAIIRDPGLGGVNEIVDETRRALQLFVDDGVISDLVVASDRDEGGRVAVLLSYRDRASARPVDLAYVPMGA